ncbi:hypothetical protein H2201_007965 [Coniosporium apollinis]|uniref:Peroxin/Ferlin domain-containing protein n=1 Tax=Coniosporium apollinis TaxID=61459 RepID=A0ABQ9NHC7_9PEZI|nr:hypothetical protein H2201_007965 [Coniosporium apollinis]
MNILSSHSSSVGDLSSSDAAKYDHQIKLVDHTKAEGDEPAAQADSDHEDILSPKLSNVSLSHKLTRGSLRKQVAQRKYRKWQDSSIPEGTEGEVAAGASNSKDVVTVNTKQAQAATDEIDQASEEAPTGSDTTLKRAQTKLQRGGHRVKSALQRKRASKTRIDADVEIDILYENQRGSFFFGIPLFSHNSLLNFDPSPWVDARYKPSAVNITNAQVPDPSWEWAWKSWYVDMSHDVDEEGWQYSFSFQKGFSWHGTHPWFHSFVRRRRWLRKRERRHGHRVADMGAKTMKEAHLLTAEYFTIHPTRTRSEVFSITSSEAEQRSQSMGGLGTRIEDVEPVEEIRDIPTLMRRLRRAAIDREKILAVCGFLEHGGEELYYLAEQMPAIMSMLIFQTSRRQLLGILMERFEEALHHRDEHVERGETEDDAEKRLIDNLLKALEAADDEVKKLEYWSDIRDIARESDTLSAVGSGHGWGHEWQGVHGSGPGSPGGPSPVQHDSDGEAESGFKDKGKGKETSPPRPDQGQGQEQKKVGMVSPNHPSKYEHEVSSHERDAELPQAEKPDKDAGETPNDQDLEAGAKGGSTTSGGRNA